MKTMCGKPGCKYTAKQYGVCGVHRRWAFTDNSPEFQSDLAIMQELYDLYNAYAADLEYRGYDILGIQGYWNNNLTKTPLDKLPPHFYNLGLSMNRIMDKIREMQLKYDNNLVYITQLRINHASGSFPCNCDYCSLGSNNP